MSAIPAPDLNSVASRADPPNGFSSMSSADFIRIIFTELANQDPFQPNDSSALLNQLSSIRNIESDLELMDHLQRLVFENQLSSGAALIGRVVDGLATTNDQVAGVVSSVTRSGNDIILQLDNGYQIPIDNVRSIFEAPPPAQPAPAPVPPPEP